MKTRYISYRLDHGSQVGNSNSEEFPFYTAKTPKANTFGVFVALYFISFISLLCTVSP